MKEGEFYITSLDPAKNRVRINRWDRAHAAELAVKRSDPIAKEKKRLYDKEYRKRRTTILRGRQHSASYNAKPEVKEHRKLWRKTRISTLKDYTLRKRYGISLSEMNAMVKAQHGRCAICRTLLETPHVDHIDVDGKPFIRGILCNNCNTGLGLFKDRHHLLMAAMDYLTDSILKLEAAKPAGGVQ